MKIGEKYNLDGSNLTSTTMLINVILFINSVLWIYIYSYFSVCSIYVFFNINLQNFRLS